MPRGSHPYVDRAVKRIRLDLGQTEDNHDHEHELAFTLAASIQGATDRRIAMILVGSTSAVAQAKTGTTQLFRGVRFYFAETAGHSDSNNFTGYGLGGSTVSW